MHTLLPLAISTLAPRSVDSRADVRGRDGPSRWPTPERSADDGLDVWLESGVLHVDGVIDAATVAGFEAALRRCDDDPSIYALDLTRVHLFSAAAVGALVSAGWSHRPHAIVIASSPVRRILEMCDLDVVLERHGWTDTPAR